MSIPESLLEGGIPVLHSTETRWFIAHTLPDEVLDWFRAGILLDSEGVRDHEYLLFPGCDSVGVKLRDGRFEIKAICGSPQPLNSGLGIAGSKQHWVKWSLASDALQLLEAPLHRSGQWINVRKERYLRQFSFNQGALLEVTEKQGAFPAMGCNVEVTRIEVNAEPRRWFTIGLEAFGAPAVTAHILDDALRLFFGTYGPPPSGALTENNSASYPAWLTQLFETG